MKATNIDYVDKVMDELNEHTENMKMIQEALAIPIGAAVELNEHTENMKMIQEALSIPIGAAVDSDEDELEAELEESEGVELEEQLLQPATTAPAAPVFKMDFYMVLGVALYKHGRPETT